MAPFRANRESVATGHRPQWPQSDTLSQLSESSLRQHSSFPLDSTLIAGDTPEQVYSEEPVSSSSSAWDIIKCFLYLKDTAAASNWKFIGRRLGLSEGDIEVINKRCSSDIKEMCYQMMLKWRSMKGEKATKECLIEALRKEKLNEIVEKLEKYS